MTSQDYRGLTAWPLTRRTASASRSPALRSLSTIRAWLFVSANWTVKLSTWRSMPWGPRRRFFIRLRNLRSTAPLHRWRQPQCMAPGRRGAGQISQRPDETRTRHGL